MIFPRKPKTGRTLVAVALALTFLGLVPPAQATKTVFKKDFEIGGSLTVDTNLTVTGTSTMTGAQTLTGATTFTASPTFPTGGIVLKGTSFNDTLKALAAQGQASTLTLDDVGGASGFVYTMTAAQASPGVLSRADMVTETNVNIYRSVTSHVKNLDGSALAAASAAGKFGISTTATFGSPANIALISENAQGNTKTDSCEFELMLPPDYVAGSNITVNVESNVTGGGTLGATKTLTVDAFKVAADGTVGSNLGPAAGTLATGAASNQAFAITPTGLVAGNKLLIQIQVAVQETGGVSAINANLTDINVQTSVKM